MALPVNIHELINGKSIEWERLEFKKGWNPEDIIHSMCAFANDINNWGGGYIILGIEEQNGRPVLPPIGINPDSIDGIQKKLLELYNRIQPYYRPIVAPYVYEGQHILVIWVPAGDMRPYTAPETHGKTAQQRFHYIRVGSVTKKALGEDLRKLQELTARIPHDDRINQDAQLNDLKLSKIQAYLQQINSSLFEECQNMPFADLCRQMNIARGPDENLRPINVGLLFFNDKPHTFFDRAQIEIVIHKDETGRGFIEETFQGPLNKQLTDALFFLKQMVVRKQTIKIQGKAEAQTVYTYPFEALEEVLANAVYHKSYEYNNPIEIQVFPNSIEILSFPGPLPPITQQDLKKYRVTARNYRNRRIGDFLKELKLTEGRGTGFPFIRSNLKRNASPEPEFITDDDKTYFLAILKIHPEFETEEQASFNDIANINNVHDLDSLQSLLDHILTHDLDVKFVVKLADAKLSARANARVHARADEI
ncbi:MAG: transcriptional regulator, partial [Prolixibacteraceae bacterium]|nr:transcriptional regulator [Prolixibacteraceae bacterium]